MGLCQEDRRPAQPARRHQRKPMRWSCLPGSSEPSLTHTHCCQSCRVNPAPLHISTFEIYIFLQWELKKTPLQEPRPSSSLQPGSWGTPAWRDFMGETIQNLTVNTQCCTLCSCATLDVSPRKPKHLVCSNRQVRLSALKQ